MSPEEYLNNKYGQVFKNTGEYVSKRLLYYFMMEYANYIKKQTNDPIEKIQEIWK